MYSLYILRHSITKEIYIGRTNNLKRRFEEHNSGTQVSTHRKSGEWKVVYVEIYKSKSDADTRELKLKQHGSSKRELLKRIKSSIRD